MRRRDLRGAVVVVTGATSGAPRATARLLADRGARLVLAARSADALEEVAAECLSRGAEVLTVPTDMAVEEDVEHLAAAAVERFRGIDVWINAAAIAVAARFGEEPVEEDRRLIDTNILGYVLGARAALRQFRAQGQGTLINVASVLAVIPNPLMATYVMSKFAVRGLSLSLHHLVAAEPGIRVCLVLPGPIDTPLFQRSANHLGRGIRAIPPALSPERVAATIISVARRPRREVTVGVLMRLALLAHHVLPGTTELVVGRIAAALVVRRTVRVPDTPGSLFEPPEHSEVAGGWRRGRLRRRLGELAGTFRAHHV